LAGSGGAKVRLFIWNSQTFSKKRINLDEEIVILTQSAISTVLFPAFSNHFVPKITSLATHKHWDV